MVLNIGILAHVDAGKTTITENFLFLSGAIRSQGSVDKGTAQTDNLNIERERGISVQAALTSFYWQDCKINLIDTPGHADFAAEVERSLPAMDAAILVINAADGVQGQTGILWNALKQNHVPTIIFINKIDRAGVDSIALVEEIKKELGPHIAILQSVKDEGSEKATLSPQSNPFQPEFTDDLIEQLAEHDEKLLESYLSDQTPDSTELQQIMKQLILDAKVVPMMFGSAKAGTGVRELLDSTVSFFREDSERKIEESVSGIVFKIKHDKTLGRMAGIRMFKGKLKVKDEISLTNQEDLSKVNQLKIAEAGKVIDVKEIFAGDIAWVSGLNSVKIGDIIGKEPQSINSSFIGKPLLTTKVTPFKKDEFTKLAAALEILATEDPALDFVWHREEKELQVKIMGWVQIDILKYSLKERFNLEAECESPTVIYKETPTTKGEAIERYTMPKPCWAVVHFLIEPGERGSGIQYESKVSVDKIHQKYQNEVSRTIPKALKQGIKGWEVTDLKITLVDGEDHEIHSRPGDFILATPVGIMKGLQESGTTLLEPVLEFKITAPEEMLGQVVSDITQMRGTFESPEILEDRFEMKGTLPLSTSMDYQVKLTSRSGGKARINTQFLKYQKCSDEEGVIREYKGICPLDRSKWILKMRGAMQE